jgi:hypothetical protein
MHFTVNLRCAGAKLMLEIERGYGDFSEKQLQIKIQASAVPVGLPLLGLKIGIGLPGTITTVWVCV